VVSVGDALLLVRHPVAVAVAVEVVGDAVAVVVVRPLDGVGDAVGVAVAVDVVGESVVVAVDGRVGAGTGFDLIGNESPSLSMSRKSGSPPASVSTGAAGLGPASTRSGIPSPSLSVSR
jgi:hypothetical protein